MLQVFVANVPKYARWGSTFTKCCCSTDVMRCKRTLFRRWKKEYGKVSPISFRSENSSISLVENGKTLFPATFFEKRGERIANCRISQKNLSPSNGRKNRKVKNKERSEERRVGKKRRARE